MAGFRRSARWNVSMRAVGGGRWAVGWEGLVRTRFREPQAGQRGREAACPAEQQGLCHNDLIDCRWTERAEANRNQKR